MSLSDIVNVTITAQTTTVSRLGFGTPLVMAYHNVIPDLVREYRSLSAMVSDGFATTDAAYVMASRVFSQNPKPRAIKVGRRQSAFTQTVRLTPVNTTEDFVYSFSIVNGATTTAITYTVPSSATVASICTALQALIDAVSGVSATDDTTHVTVATDTAGSLVDYVGTSTAPDDLEFLDVTTDPGIAADLNAIEQVDADGWYCLLLDSQSEAQVAAAAAWIESRKKIFLYNTSDTGCTDVSVTDDVMSDLQDSSYARTAGLYSAARLLNYSAAAWGGNRLPSDPGSSTWAFKTLAGPTVDTTLTGSQVSAIESKNGNLYRPIGGVNVTTFGRAAEGEFIDITRTIDWLDARIKERIFGVLANNAKIPFTDAGIDIIRNEVIAQLQVGINNGALAADPAPLVTAPLAADVDNTNKGNRNLPDIFFQATLAGAVHTVEVEGVLSL